MNWEQNETIMDRRLGVLRNRMVSVKVCAAAFKYLRPGSRVDAAA